MSHTAYATTGERHKARNLTQEQKGENQVKNSDGAYVFGVDPWKRLDRFLILGSEGGSYYASEQKLTKANAKSVRALIAEDGVRVVNRVVEISDAGRAPKNDPALFVLAMASAIGGDATRSAAYSALPAVARIGTHLFHFIAYRESFTGWSRGLRSAVAHWYNDKPIDDLALQVLKYQQRDGWSHRDLLRLAHIKPKDELYSLLYQYVTSPEDVGAADFTGLPLVAAYETVKVVEGEGYNIVEKYNMPLELVPPEKRTDKIYKLMLKNFGMTALLRNLGVLTSRGILSAKNFKNVNDVVARLTNKKAIARARIHPLSVLVALKIYEQGHGMRGNLEWAPVPQIIDALNDAFYLAFANVEPTNLRYLLALDVSGSMRSPIVNMPLTARDASGAMAMVTARTEPNYVTLSFSGAYGAGQWGIYHADDITTLAPLNITPRQRLDDVIKTISGLPFGSTDCSLPMRYAEKERIPIDVFVVYTDSETNNYGQPDPMAALRRYRGVMNLPESKLVVVGMTSNGFTIADPNDAGTLDIVGFDSSAPEIMRSFALGEI